MSLSTLPIFLLWSHHCSFTAKVTFHELGRFWNDRQFVSVSHSTHLHKQAWSLKVVCCCSDPMVSDPADLPLQQYPHQGGIVGGRFQIRRCPRSNHFNIIDIKSVAWVNFWSPRLDHWVWSHSCLTAVQDVPFLFSVQRFHGSFQFSW